MQVVLTVTLTPDDLTQGAIAQARAAAAAAIANSTVLANVACTSNVQASAPSTFAFDLTPASGAGAGVASVGTGLSSG